MLAVAAHRTSILHTRSPGTTGPPITWQGNMRKMGEELEDTKVPACGTHRTGLSTHSNPAQQGTPQRGRQASTRGKDEGRRGDEERKHQLRPNTYKLGYDSWGEPKRIPGRRYVQERPAEICAEVVNEPQCTQSLYALRNVPSRWVALPTMRCKLACTFGLGGPVAVSISAITTHTTRSAGHVSLCNPSLVQAGRVPGINTSPVEPSETKKAVKNCSKNATLNCTWSCFDIPDLAGSGPAQPLLGKVLWSTESSLGRTLDPLNDDKPHRNGWIRSQKPYRGARG
ncbi:hypothetical protein B0H11DRAFT_2194797 [Mycena galericulata]|nr:hypothetical protein B0H11DRAFT_2194797 [Mycena galericulata]